MSFFLCSVAGLRSSLPGRDTPEKACATINLVTMQLEKGLCQVTSVRE
jgi:hypothetical protein